MGVRIEFDPLGEKTIPNDVYFGIQTFRAIENFPVSGLKASTYFIKAYVLVKKATPIENLQGAWLDKKIFD